ncbi:MAG TPA: TfoX/Sxy family protein, partial [Segetibacter sp.]|nr:TfoX/Sxy family protein [Segetibacter sp.]
MAFNEELADRIRVGLSHLPKVEEKKMFGGLAFMVANKMCITAGADRIMCRIDPAIHEDVINRKSCSTVIMRGREIKGYVYVNEESIKNRKDVDYWMGL